MRGGELWDSAPRQGGGGASASAAAVADASQAYNAQTAGYTQLGGNEMDNSIVTSSGTRLMVNQPFDARGGNPDCLKGGARRRNSKKASRKSKRSN
jgi:hypothetical protein